MKMATEEEMRRHRCCFTGHRPNKLHRSEKEIKSDLEKEIRTAIDEGFHVFITGMAQGVDIWAAQIVLKIRNEGHAVRLICASPYEGIERRWRIDWQQQYNEIIQKADLMRFICPGYCPSCFQIRNEWMVRHASRVIAVFNGEHGGTKNTIDFARKQGILVRVIEG